MPDSPDQPDAVGILPIVGSGLSVRRDGRTLLAAVDLTIEAGPLTVLMGPNGAGKSLLLRVLAALIPADSGRVTWAGALPTRALAPHLGFVFQKPVLLRRSVAANVRYALKAAGVPGRERDARTMAALADGGLGRLADAPARVLSGGEQQRLAIARAIATRPKALLLDEPTASLDPAATLAIEDLVRAAHHGGTKVVFVTHDLGQARRLGDEIVFMHAGGIAERAPAERFFAAPKSAAADAFLQGRLMP